MPTEDPARLASHYRLLALDLDGTLLDAQMRIRDDARAALQDARAQGIQVMLVTGRHHTTTAPYIAELQLDTPAICCNGAYIYDFAGRRTLYAQALSTQQALCLLTLMRRHRLNGFLYADDAIVYEQADVQINRLIQWGEGLAPALRPTITAVASLEDFARQATQIWKLVLSPSDPSAYQQFAQEVAHSLALEGEQSGRNWFDIAQKGNSKGATLAYWLKQQAIAAHEVVAFGDNHNDVGMFKLAGLGIAMSNAVAAVQSHADLVIGHHDSGAIAQAIRQHVLAQASAPASMPS